MAARTFFDNETMEKFLFMRILSLLKLKLIDRSRASNTAYVMKAYSDARLHKGIEYRMYIDTEAEFVEQARRALDQKAKFTAVLLLFTAIEHTTNQYVRMFGQLRGMSEEYINDMIRKVSHDHKLTWLGSLLGFALPDALAKQVAELRSARNKIVHCTKAPAIWRERDEVDGSFAVLNAAIRGIPLRRYLTLPDKLANCLHKAYCRCDPDFDAALIVLRTLKKGLRSKRKRNSTL